MQKLLNFIHLSSILTKLCHNKCDHLANFYKLLENAKNRDISATVRPISTKFVMMMQNMCIKCAARYKCILQSKIADGQYD